VVDFSEYVTAHALWREGAIAMGRLTTESAWTRLIAAQVEATAQLGDEGSSDRQSEAFSEIVLSLMEE
jgi:aspartyl-tRNA(Asn)/glutamyl-tRNA(Gln) amidotransferase subunit B